MSTNFIPTRDAELIGFSANFATKISSSPGSYGLDSAMAAHYSALHAGLVSAYNTAITPATRTRGAVASKNAARAAVKSEARRLARIIQATSSVTAQQKINLGLSVPPEVVSPILPPTEPPVLQVAAVMGRTIRLALRPAASDRRGKPDGIRGASVFSFIGAEPPANIAEWRYEGSSTRTNCTVQIPSDVAAGSQLWLTAFWFNPRSQRGPACEPVCTYIAGGVTMAA